MSQSTDAAERSAHVIRGGDAEAPQGPPLIRLFRDAQGKEAAQLEVVAALQEENARLRAALEMAFREGWRAGDAAGYSRAADDAQGIRSLDAATEDAAWRDSCARAQGEPSNG